jgi:hypothetical protein
MAVQGYTVHKLWEVLRGSGPSLKKVKRRQQQILCSCGLRVCLNSLAPLYTMYVLCAHPHETQRIVCMHRGRAPGMGVSDDSAWATRAALLDMPCGTNCLTFAQNRRST